MSKESPDIKIFVSHRIDQDSETIDNPLYVNVRCGAVFDKREGVTMLGDDTGDNISQKRDSYCELTVQYWAWKNVEADYYGLCHYRRYLSFKDEKIPGAWQGLGFLDSMSISNQTYCNLLDVQSMRNEIERYDLILPTEFSVNTTITPRGTDFENTYHYVSKAWEHLFIEKCDIDNMLRIIDEKFPQYSKSAHKYMCGKTFRGFNIFILKKELFYSLCEFEFGVVAEIEALISFENASESRMRAVGYLGEILFSIWAFHHSTKNSVRLKEKQIIFFQNTSKSTSLTLEKSNNNIVNIIYECKMHELPILAISIQSLLDHVSPQNLYNIIVLMQTVPENKWFQMQIDRNKQLLNQILLGYKNVFFQFYDPKNELGEKDVRLYDQPNIEHDYYRLISPWIFRNYKKIIYLTPFILLCEDVACLYLIEMQGKLIGAAYDLLCIGFAAGYDEGLYKHLNTEIGLANPLNYFSTDIMVMDLDKIRRKYSLATVLTTLEKWNLNSIAHDAMNRLFEKDVYFLGQEWNFINCPALQVLWCIDYAPAKLVKEYKSIKEPKAIHYIQPFPWEHADCDFSEQFWFIARKTPFYELVLCMMIDSKIGGPNIFDSRTGIRKFADKLLPKGSRRRNFAKKLFPKGSLRWRFCKQIYYIVRPRYRPVKVEKSRQK